MLTLFSEVENIVNSGLLTYLSEDHKDLEALTLNHFLIGRNFYNDCLVNDICNKDVWEEKSDAKFRFGNAYYILHKFPTPLLIRDLKSIC